MKKFPVDAVTLVKVLLDTWYTAIPLLLDPPVRFTLLKVRLVWWGVGLPLMLMA